MHTGRDGGYSISFSVVRIKIPWSRQLIKDNVELGVLFLGLESVMGGMKAWPREQLRVSISNH